MAFEQRPEYIFVSQIPFDNFLAYALIERLTYMEKVIYGELL